MDNDNGTGPGDPREPSPPVKSEKLMASSDPHVRVVAVMQSEESEADLNRVCAELNGSMVDILIARSGELEAISPSVGGSDVLLIDVDPRARGKPSGLAA